MFTIDEFCKKRKIPRKIKDAFVAYCKGVVHERYNIRSEQTATGLLMKFTEEELETRWLEFIQELHDTLSQEEVA